MLQVNPENRPDIREVLTGLEAIAVAMDVDLKGTVVTKYFVYLFVCLFFLLLIIFNLDKLP